MTSEPDGTELLDLAVVGGGIVGLATAYALLRRAPGLRVAVFEKEPAVAAHQTGRNSGVVHSGLYYAPGSAKARTCVRGATALRSFCAAEQLPFEVVGKVVVAVDPSELPRLDDLERRGRANGVPDLRRVDAAGLREIEPHARGVAALHVPHAAIVDYAAVSRALAARIEAAGGAVRTGVRVTAIASAHGVRELHTAPGGVVPARAVIACAGLHSDRLARAAERRPVDARIVPFRGEYHVLAPEREHLVRGLIYPVPDPRFPFLGVHFTRMVRGGVECGPNAVLAFRREGYSRTAFSLRDTLSTFGWPGFWRLAARHARTGIGEFHRSFSAAAFARALQRLVPEVRAEDLRPGSCGVRAQALDRRGALLDDFRIIDGDRSLHVINAPSPAATAAFAIAEEIVARAGARGLVSLPDDGPDRTAGAAR